MVLAGKCAENARKPRCNGAGVVFLGVVASGIGYFMWNYGATQVDAGTLGIMNNMHVPPGC